MEQLKEMIKQHEGLILIPYEDTTGNLTIGWGHKLKGSPIPMEAAELILDRDISIAVAEVHRLPIGF